MASPPWGRNKQNGPELPVRSTWPQETRLPQAAPPHPPFLSSLLRWHAGGTSLAAEGVSVRPGSEMLASLREVPLEFLPTAGPLPGPDSGDSSGCSRLLLTQTRGLGDKLGLG